MLRVGRLIERAPWHLLGRKSRPRALRILMYHYFGAGGSDPLVLDPQFFAAQVRWLADNCEVVDLHDALSAWAAGRELPRHATAITVDDVGADFAAHAWPVLERLRLPATLFVCPGLLDPAAWSFTFGHAHAWARQDPAMAERLLTALGLAAAAYEDLYETLRDVPTEQLRKACERAGIPVGRPGAIPGYVRLPLCSADDLRRMVDTGLVKLGSHTFTHPTLPRVHGPWLEWELEEARAWIERTTGAARPILAYPGGAPPSPQPGEDLASRLRRAGHDFAVDVAPGWVAADSDPFHLPRIAVIGGEPLARFRLRATGTVALARRLLGRG